MEEEYTTIRLKVSNRNELAKRGGKDDSFDDIIEELLKRG